jgi:hypothetical protein
MNAVTHLIAPALGPLSRVWVRRAASVSIAAGTTIVVAKAVQEVSKAIVEVKNLVNVVKGVPPR